MSWKYWCPCAVSKGKRHKSTGREPWFIDERQWYPNHFTHTCLIILWERFFFCFVFLHKKELSVFWCNSGRWPGQYGYRLVPRVPCRGGQSCLLYAHLWRTHPHKQVCMCTFMCVCVCICVPTGVREIIASEPGGECRQAITHGRGVERSWGLAEEMCWENLHRCTYAVITLTFPQIRPSYTSSPNISVTQNKILMSFHILAFKDIFSFVHSIFHTLCLSAFFPHYCLCSRRRCALLEIAGERGHGWGCCSLVCYDRLSHWFAKAVHWWRRPSAAEDVERKGEMIK